MKYRWLQILPVAFLLSSPARGYEVALKQIVSKIKFPPVPAKNVLVAPIEQYRSSPGDQDVGKLQLHFSSGEIGKDSALLARVAAEEAGRVGATMAYQISVTFNATSDDIETVNYRCIRRGKVLLNGKEIQFVKPAVWVGGGSEMVTIAPYAQGEKKRALVMFQSVAGELEGKVLDCEYVRISDGDALVTLYKGKRRGFLTFGNPHGDHPATLKLRLPGHAEAIPLNYNSEKSETVDPDSILLRYEHSEKN